MKVTVELAGDGKTKSIAVEKGVTLSDVLTGGGIHIDMPCGGNGICKRCSVRINGELRLACRTKVDGDMLVELPRQGDFAHILSGGDENIMPKDPLYTRFGLSIDIGTTTICARLCGVNSETGVVTRKNPQAVFGADVVSRIEKALGGKADELAECIRKAIAEMAAELAATQNIKAEEIDAAVITGNTTMLYLLVGQDPAPLSHAPFKADRLFGEAVPANSLDIGISPDGTIYLTRCISAFIGGDITSAILASGMCCRDGTALLADIGTNGEIALWHDGNLQCCSTAAGPAFEGAGISCGVYAVTGAIDAVSLADGHIRCSTIGGLPAVGVCGSGVVDAVALMLKLGIIDETGAFTGDSGEFKLCDGVFITAQDVRKIQLAKGSVRAGIETLLQTLGVKKSGIQKLYISGGFGNYINLENAAAIGLIPPEPLNNAEAVGNAAHTGATMLLQDKTLISKSEILAKSANTVALDANPVFTDNYMRYMFFGM